MLALTNRIVKDKMKIYLWSSKAFSPLKTFQPLGNVFASVI